MDMTDDIIEHITGRVSTMIIIAIMRFFVLIFSYFGAPRTQNVLFRQKVKRTTVHFFKEGTGNNKCDIFFFVFPFLCR